MNKISSDTKKSMLERIITSIILVFVALPAVFVGSWFFLALVAVALFFMVHEFINAPHHKAYTVFVHIFIYVMTYSFVFWIFLKNNLNIDGFKFQDWTFENNFKEIRVSTIGVASTIFVLFLMSILHTNFRIEDVTYLFSMVIFIGISVQSVLYLRYVPLYQSSLIDNSFTTNMWSESFLLLYVIIGTFASDIGAYFVGLTFGKNKMNPRISPKKTWEGFAGGVVFSIILSFGFGILVSECGLPMHPLLDTKHWYWLLLSSVVIPFMGNLGDFIFSALKRHFNIKDYGTLLRGHGGVLDRCDSLLVSSLTVSILLIFITNGWNLLI